MTFLPAPRRPATRSRSESTRAALSSIGRRCRTTPRTRGSGGTPPKLGAGARVEGGGPEVDRWPAAEARPERSSRRRQLRLGRLDEEPDPFRGAAKPAPESPEQPEQPPCGIDGPAQSLQ